MYPSNYMAEEESLLHGPANFTATSSVTEVEPAAWTSLQSSDSSRILKCVFALVVLDQFCFYVLEVPTVRLIEKVICEKHFSASNNHVFASQFGNEVNEARCKIPIVQSELAIITGLKATFDAIPGLLTAIYFGGVADRHGRKRIVLLSFLGTYSGLVWFLSICRFSHLLPVRLVWISALFLLMGGGNRVFMSMMSTIVTDHVLNVQRSRFLFLNPVAGALASLLAPPLVRQLMASSVWLPFHIVLALGPVTLSIIILMPATRKPLVHQTSQIIGPLGSESDRRHIIYLLGQKIHRLQNAPLLSRGLIVCYVCFCLKRMGFLSLGFLYQYISGYFGWQMRETASLQFMGAVSVTVCLMALPLISTLIISRNKMLRPEKLDHALVIGSALVLSLSFAALWMVRTTMTLYLAVFANGLGEGLEPALQGVAAFLVDDSHIARMFTIIASSEALGRILGGPLMTWLFFAGYGSQNKLYGFCFMASSIIFAVITALSSCFLL